MKAIQFLFFAAFSLFISCQKDEPRAIVFTEKTYAEVDSDLWPFYREFEEQAALRGVEIDLNSFGTAVIAELNPNGVAGQCTYGSHLADVVIDKGFWEDVPNYLIREMVVFHELGHCYLKRGHEEGVLPNGTCASIMRSGLEDCQDNYNSNTRADYLDELFSEVIP